MSYVLKQFPVEKEYEKNLDISPEDIQKLRTWLNTQPHLPGQYLTDLDLVLVYHCCDRSVGVAKQVLDLHYTARTLFTTYFKDRCFDKTVEFTTNVVLYAALPTPTVHGDRAVYLRLLDYDPRNFNLNDVIRTFMIMFDLWQYEEGTWPGFVIIIDMDKAVMGHIMRLDVMSIKKILYFLQECMLIKLRSFHFLNAPYFMDKLMMMLKPFLKKALLDTIHIHQVDSDSIHKIIAKDAFPKEEGGQYKDHDTIRDDLLRRFEANKQIILDENRRRVNEGLRPGGKPAAVEELFGIQGSFKKLDID